MALLNVSSQDSLNPFDDSRRISPSKSKQLGPFVHNIILCPSGVSFKILDEITSLRKGITYIVANVGEVSERQISAQEMTDLFIKGAKVSP